MKKEAQCQGFLFGATTWPCPQACNCAGRVASTCALQASCVAWHACSTSATALTIRNHTARPWPHRCHRVEVEPQSDLNCEVHNSYNKILRFEVRAYSLSWNLKWNLKATSIAVAQFLQQDIAIRSSGLLLKLEPQTEPQSNLNRGCTVFTTRYCDLRF